MFIAEITHVKSIVKETRKHVINQNVESLDNTLFPITDNQALARVDDQLMDPNKKKLIVS